MTYRKPEVDVLGNAVAVITDQLSKSGNPFDGQSPIDAVGPAYDLDE